jgi:Family of unknown function (DUF6502)
MNGRGTAGVKTEYLGILTVIFEFMLVCQLSKREISNIAIKALKRANGLGNYRKDPEGYLATAALVLDAWHRDRRYMNARGEPRPIRLAGAHPSVHALLSAERVPYQRKVLARQLRIDRLIVPCGRGLYKPASDVALLSALDSVAVQHVGRTVATLLETIRGNLAFPRPSQRLIERIAEIPDLPVEQVPAFRRFTQMQGWVLLRTVNDWLESRRVRPTSRRAGKGVRAGIHLHSYVGVTPPRILGSTPR